MEARDFRSHYEEFTARGAAVVGVSKDSEERHASFRSTLGLPFPLISDEGSEIAKAYGLTRAGGWLPSKRATFVIDTEGVVQRAITAELDIGEHVRESLAALDELD